jgi:hypothetical protein
VSLTGVKSGRSFKLTKHIHIGTLLIREDLSPQPQHTFITCSDTGLTSRFYVYINWTTLYQLQRLVASNEMRECYGDELQGVLDEGGGCLVLFQSSISVFISKYWSKPCKVKVSGSISGIRTRYFRM